MKKTVYIAVIFSVLLLSVVLAVHSLAPASFSFNETLTTNQYNITINNTDVGSVANISQINITIPSTFTIIPDSNGSNADAELFENTSTTLSWTNSTVYLINGTIVDGGEWKYFWFNASATTPGTYNITVLAVNDTGSNEQNISVEINDTTAPFNVSFDGISPANNTNLSQNFIAVNITVDDTDGTFAGTLGNISYSLYYSNGTLINNTLDSTNSILINFTGLGDRTYHINVTANDSAGNLNATGESTRVVVLDTTNPTTSFSCTPTIPLVGERMVCSCSSSDAGSGVLSVSYNSRPVAAAGENTETCTVTDYAGNTADATETYTSSYGSSGTSTGTTTSTFWERTTVATSTQFVNGHTKELEAKHRIRFKIGAATHYLGIAELTATTAKINISSTPQQATLSIGEEKKFAATNDSVYDVLVKLNSISDDKASITITSIYEETTAATAPAQTPAGNATDADSGPGADADTDDEDSGFSVIGMIIGIVVAIIIIFFGYKIIGRKRRRY